MRLTTEFGNVNAKHHRKLHGGRVYRIGVRLTVEDSDGLLYALEVSEWEIDHRTEMTAEWLQAKVRTVLASHDLNGRRLVGVEANTTDVIWSTPYEDLYPQGVGT